MANNENARYSIDTSALIHAWRRAYPPKNFVSFWAKIENLIDDGVVLASVEVLNELKKKDDEIYSWCNGRPGYFCVEIDDDLQEHLAHIMGTYPRLVDTVKGRSGGDPRGPWMTSSYVNPATREQRQNLGYAILNPFTHQEVVHPTHAWKYSFDEHRRHVAENMLWWGVDGNAQYPRLKLFLNEANMMVPVDVWDYTEVGGTATSPATTTPCRVGGARKFIQTLSSPCNGAKLRTAWWFWK